MFMLDHKGKTVASGGALEEYYDATPYQWVTVRLPGMRKPHRFKIAKETTPKYAWLFRGIAEAIEKQDEIGCDNIEHHRKIREQRDK